MERVATITLAPGPLADVGSAGCAALIGELTRLAVDPPRALLLDATAGVGTVESRPLTPTGLRDPAALVAEFPAPTVALWTAPRSVPARR